MVGEVLAGACERSTAMKAIMKRSRGVGDVALVDLAVPRAGPGQVLAQVAYGGICGSDLDILNSRNTIYQPPVVLGHEFSAIAVEVGAGVGHVRPGDKLVSETTFRACGECEQCRSGDYHLCTNKAVVGWTVHGAFAEYVLLNADYVHVLRADADLQSVALVEPMAIAAEAVHLKGRLQRGESVAVIGPGATGILSALLAQAQGAAPVFLVGRASSVPVRFPIARALGLEHCINAAETDPAEYVLVHNGGRRVDLAIDATGSEQGFVLALDLLRRNGRVVELGSITTEAPFPWPEAAWKALELAFVYSSSHDAWDIAVEVFHRRTADLSKMVTGVYPLEDYQRAFAAADNSQESLKVMFRPSGGS